MTDKSENKEIKVGYAKFQLLKGPEGLVAGGWKGIKVKEEVKERGSNTRALTRRLAAESTAW